MPVVSSKAVGLAWYDGGLGLSDYKMVERRGERDYPTMTSCNATTINQPFFSKVKYQLQDGWRRTLSTGTLSLNPISEGIQNHEVLKAGAIQWPPHISGVSGPILMILDSKQGFLRSRNWLVRVSHALHVSYTCQARVIVSLPQSPRNHLRMCMNM